MILFGERSLWHVLNEYVAHYHTERPHQGKGNMILFPPDHSEQRREGPVCYRVRLGRLLKYYDRKAA
jgi:putative transposase